VQQEEATTKLDSSNNGSNRRSSSRGSSNGGESKKSSGEKGRMTGCSSGNRCLHVVIGWKHLHRQQRNLQGVRAGASMSSMSIGWSSKSSSKRWREKRRNVKKDRRVRGSRDW
jgi:hypothetical protein